MIKIKPTIHIIYPNYLAKNGQGMSVGGIQTYLSNLIELIISKGLKVCLYQTADFDFSVNEENINIYAYKTKEGINVSKFLYDKCKIFLKEDDIIIFGTDFQIIKTDCKKVIGIQHGISWDIPNYNVLNKPYKYLKEYCRKAYNSWKRVNCISHADCIVCVDYNFVNWYRAIVPLKLTELTVIPNFTFIPSPRYQRHENNDKVRIIFARRFFTYRGTKLFANVVERILQKYPQVEVTFAGEGPDETYIRSKFDSNKRVTVIKYNSEESIKIHMKHDIAVIPTVGSEGTSLSLLEAMASSCAVVCSNVGGMSNIVLDGYNGMMFDPYSEDELYIAIDNLINDTELRYKLSEQAYSTVKESFSLEKWRCKWSNVIDKFLIKV